MQDLPDISPFCAERALGQGGVGQVYKASDTNNGALAIKVVHPEIAGNEAIVDAILTNAQELRAVDHPNLVRIHDAGHLNDGRPFVSMEYLDGVDLVDLLAKNEALPFTRVVRLGRQLCAGLSALHANNLLHLDLKPANVLVLGEGDEEQAKLLDLGLAATGTAFSKLDLGPGTPEYWSPEHARGAVDERSDIYSLGVLLYEALTGATPFSSHSVAEVIAQHLHAEPSRLSPPSAQPPIPEGLQEIVLRCLRKDPELRYQSVDELLAALDALDRQLLSPRTVDGNSTWGPTARSNRRTWLLVAALAVALAAGAVYAHRTTNDRRLAAPPAAVEVEVTVTSEPSGANIYRVGGGALTGRTPATVKLPRGDDPIDLLLRFPSGKQAQLTIVPDRAVQIDGVEPKEAP